MSRLGAKSTVVVGKKTNVAWPGWRVRVEPEFLSLRLRELSLLSLLRLNLLINIVHTPDIHCMQRSRALF